MLIDNYMSLGRSTVYYVHIACDIECKFDLETF